MFYGLLIAIIFIIVGGFIGTKLQNGDNKYLCGFITGFVSAFAMLIMDSIK